MVCEYSDAAGQISGFVPANANLSMELLNDFNGSIYSKPLGRFMQDTQVGTIAIDLGSTQIVFASTPTFPLIPKFRISIFYTPAILSEIAALVLYLQPIFTFYVGYSYRK